MLLPQFWERTFIIMIRAIISYYANKRRTKKNSVDALPTIGASKNWFFPHRYPHPSSDPPPPSPPPPPN